MSLRAILKYSLPVIAVIMLVLLAGCTDRSERESNPGVGVIDMHLEKRQMPGFNLPSPLSEDNITTSESLKGKVVLVSFFASWCRACLEEIPLLKKMQAMFGDKDFAIIAMAIDSKNKVGIKNLIQKQKINYQVLLTDEATKEGFGGVAILPTMFLVDREGKLLKKYFGHIERESLMQDIKQNFRR